MDYQFDTRICSLLLSYFAININENLELYRGYGNGVPLQSFILYVEMQVSKLNVGIHPKFDNPYMQFTIKGIFFNLYSIL